MFLLNFLKGDDYVLSTYVHSHDIQKVKLQTKLGHKYYYYWIFEYFLENIDPLHVVDYKHKILCCINAIGNLPDFEKMQINDFIKYKMTN